MNNRILSFVFAALMGLNSVSARDTYNFNSDWRIGKSKKLVTLPRAWNEDDAFKVHISDMRDSLIVYSKTFNLPAEIAGRRVFIEFEGARMMASVSVNGKEIGMSENGVMAFGFDITEAVRAGKNEIVVTTDNDWKYREKATGSEFQWNNTNFNSNYGGLPKNVLLHVTDQVYQTLPLYSNLKTTGTYVYAKDFDIQNHQATICVESEVRNETDEPVTRSLSVSVNELGEGASINDKPGAQVVGFQGEAVTIAPHSSAILKAEGRAYGLHFWSWGYGYLYKVITTLTPATPLNPPSGGTSEASPRGEVGGVAELAGLDSVVTVTGFRKAEYRNGMIYLNDRVIQVHGYAQRTSNEWPCVGMSVPAWMSDYSNDLFVKSGGNVVRWMHVCPWKQDVESCDRVGLIQAMPAGDAEKDVEGRRWEQRVELMRDAIIYNRNAPSILFYECGNQKISAEHMLEMKKIRDQYDPNGMRAIGCREMLDRPEAEYGGEMLYVNKSDTKPMWMMEYCRDEALRLYWNEWSYPYHKEGDGPLYRNAPADAYNHNQDEFVHELVNRWYDYWLERPGSGTKVNAGGVKIVFSDTQTHNRSEMNYRVSGVVDPMRIPKDAFYAHQVMWDGWVDDLNPRTYIVGHWNYEPGQVIPTIYVVSNAEQCYLELNGRRIEPTAQKSRFLYIFNNVKYEEGTLKAVGIGTTTPLNPPLRGTSEASPRGEVGGVSGAVSEWTLSTAGSPDHLKITPITNPTGWKADGHDLAMYQIEVVDAQGRRCPLDNRLIKCSVKGQGEYRGGISKGANNHAFLDTLAVECGVTRVMVRSTTKPGEVVLNVSANGLPKATCALATVAGNSVAGLSEDLTQSGLQPVLDRGETPSTPSFRQWRRNVEIIAAEAGSGDNPELSFDKKENTDWRSRGKIEDAWITYTLAETTRIDDLCLKMTSFRSTTYPIAVYAGDVKLWEGWTPKSLSYIHIPLQNCPETNTITIRMTGNSTDRDAFGAVKELDTKNDEKKQKGGTQLRILEAEFLKNL